METRAHHIMIGMFMLTMIASLFAFIIWATKVDIETEFRMFDIYFEESVAGLSIGGDVNFRGVNVGQVRKISLDPDDPGRVRVTIRIAGDTPVRADSVASLEYQGITGLSYVQIAGGTAGAEQLVAERGQQYPVIKSVPSQIQELFSGAPDLINQAIILAGRVSAFFDDDNRIAIANILANSVKISGGLADRMERIQHIIDNVDETLTDLRGAARSVNVLANSATGLVDHDIKGLVADLRLASQSIRSLSQSLDRAVQDNGKALAAFSSNTLPELALFVQEARRMASVISRIAEQLERSPSDFIFSGKKPEYDAK
ncbi:MAG: MlaD family protein [Sphingomonadales bacterium]